MTREDLKIVLDQHAKWLRDEGGSRANLTYADLTGADLTRADLTDANLTGADLTGANLTGANLTGADLTDANLTGANLTGADLTRTDLTDANLTGANLTHADLTRANLNPANLNPAIDLPTGNFRAWKRLRDGIVAELEIVGRRVSPYTDRKCRCDAARVVALTGGVSEARSIHDESFTYEVGAVVSVPDADLDPRLVCTTGIHFFVTREEAEAYNG